MKGIWFNDIHSYADLNLILSAVNIPPAVPKTTYIDIPGADGSADLTEVHGEVKYKDRECSFTFTVFPYENFEEKKTYISNLLNGKRCKIRLDKDAEYYWLGRCKVNEYASDRSLNKIVVAATVAPYKYKVDETFVAVHFCEKNLFVNDITKYTKPRDYFVCPVVLEWGKTYTASVKLTGTNMTNIVVAIAPHGDIYAELKEGMLSLIKIGGSYYAKTIFTVDQTWTSPKLAIYTTEESVASIFENYQIQLEAGDVVTTFEAYTSSADPVEVTLTNGRKTVAPTIICTGETTVTVNDSEYVLGEGTHKILDIQLHEGDTAVTLAGTGSVAIIYQEGDL